MMKKQKIITFTILVSLTLILLFSMISCASMDKYRENLGVRYTVSSVNLDFYLASHKLDEDLLEAYEIEEAIYAEHRGNGYSVVIFQCKSNSAAKDLAKDMLDSLYGGNTSYYQNIDVVQEGRFVFRGDARAIEDALGED